jgi:FdrA protein
MLTHNLIKPNRYQDSVTLMQVAERVRARDGITAAALMMGTPPNKEILQDAGQLTEDGSKAGPNDLIIALQGSEAAVAAVEADIEDLLRAEIPTPTDRAAAVPHSLAAGFAAQADSNFVLISTPGLYAAAEARKALLAGRHVMIFSDNVHPDDEESLKRLAGERGLLLMGPDCGTAIIGGVPLGFANAVRRGPIGVVGASGTGTQEVTTLIDRYGSGVSHAIGTGSHDLSQRIGGAMTIAGLRALLADPATEVVVVLSKPPHPTVAAHVTEAAAGASQPVVFAFLGMDPAALPGDHPHVAQTLEDAARQAVQLAGGTPPPAEEQPNNSQLATRNSQHVRGLFSGGTFAYEAMLILQAALGPVYSNIPLRPDLALPDPAQSREHTVLDLGADEFTVGRPHPMIDLSVRAERIRAEAADPTTGVILLDVVLGYGAHPDPAHGLADAIRAARATAQAAGRDLTIVASVCGTETDPQRLSAQQAQLAAAGVRLAPSNAAAARRALRVLSAEC